MQNTTVPLIAALVLGAFSLLASAYVYWQMKALNTLRRNFFAGATGADLEDTLNTVAAQIANLKDEHLILEQNFSNLQKAFGFAIQKIGVVRFNPFAEDGGNLSFCLALLDGHNTGLVLTSMHGRQQNRIYTKKILEGRSDVQLTDEELHAIEFANSK